MKKSAKIFLVNININLFRDEWMKYELLNLDGFQFIII